MTVYFITLFEYILTDFNNCQNFPCENSGLCIDGENSYACNCMEGYYGNDCEFEGK